MQMCVEYFQEGNVRFTLSQGCGDEESPLIGNPRSEEASE